MLRSFLINASIFGLLSVTLVVKSQDGEDLSVDELELRALTTISGSERKAKRWHRTINRYRVYLDRVESKLTKGIDEDRARSGALNRRIAMSNLATSLSPQNRDTVWQITHGTIDLKDFLESGDELAKPDSKYMEEMVVVGTIFDHMPMDPAEFSVTDIRLMRSERSRANKLYREEQYDEAYPILLDLAQRGFKDSQSRLAYILFNGTENVEKSNLRGLGWLGSAAYGDTEPQFRVLFKRYMAEVPDSVRPTVDKVVNAYQDSFAHDEHQNCSTDHKYAYGRVKRTFCRFRLEAIAEACESGVGGGLCWAHAVNTDTN